MIRTIKRSIYRCAHAKRPAGPKNRCRLMFETLEDRITPAQPLTLAPPTIINPAAPLRIDQPSYTLQGTLQDAAKNGTTIDVFRDSNNNGVYDPGVDALAASASVAMKSTAFAVTVPLQENANNQFFHRRGEPQWHRARGNGPADRGGFHAPGGPVDHSP